ENILSKNTSLTDEQIVSVLAISVGGNSSLREVLAKKASGTADEIVAELCANMGLPFIKDIPISEIPADLVTNIPINFAKKHEVLPFREDANQLTVLTTNPLNTRVLDDLRVLFKKRTVPLMTTKSRLIDAINRVYERSTAALQGLEEIEEEDYDL